MCMYESLLEYLLACHVFPLSIILFFSLLTPLWDNTRDENRREKAPLLQRRCSNRVRASRMTLQSSTFLDIRFELQINIKIDALNLQRMSCCAENVL